MFDLQRDSEQTSGCMCCLTEGSATQLSGAQWVVLGVPVLDVTLCACVFHPSSFGCVLGERCALVSCATAEREELSLAGFLGRTQLKG